MEDQFPQPKQSSEIEETASYNQKESIQILLIPQQISLKTEFIDSKFTELMLLVSDISLSV